MQEKLEKYCFWAFPRNCVINQSIIAVTVQSRAFSSVPSMSFYLDFILNLSWIYPDFIHILSRLYPNFSPDFLVTEFILILSTFYPDFILTLSWFFRNSIYPDFIRIFEKSG